MANAYTQDIILDADGKPVLDALKLVRSFMDDIQKIVAGIGVTSLADAKKWQQQLAANLKMLKQAESDLKTLQADRQSRLKGFAEVEAAARKTARIELQADREANKQKLIEAKVFYRERDRLAKESANVEKQLAKEVAEFEKAQDRAAIASAKEVAAARREAATAAVTSKARGITNRDDALAAKAASEARLNQLRREREALAANDVQAARSVANRIQIEKALGVALDATIRKLNQQTEAERRAAEAADRRLRGQVVQGRKLLAAPDVTDRANRFGATETRTFYQNEQAAAQAVLRATLASTVATDAQRLAAQKNLEIANARVRAAERLVREEERGAAAELRRNAANNHRTPLQNILTPGYAAAAFARTSIYGAAAAAAYGSFNAVSGGFQQVVQMEDELAKLQAIANATDPQLQKIKNSIYDIGGASRYALVDLVKISQTLAQSGVTAGDMKAVLESVTTLATASGSTPEEAVGLVTSALGSFQLQSSEAARVADLMTSALNRTKLTVQQTGQAIQYVGATAFEQNISLEQLLATIGAVAQAGVRSGSTIGTGFRQFLVDLSTPSEKLTRQLTALNLTSADVDVTTRGLPAVLETLSKAGFGAGQAYSSLETRAAAFYLVAKNNIDIMDQLQLSFANSGAAALANERAMNSLTAQWQRFKNNLAESFGETMEGPLNVLQDVLASISDRIEEMDRAADELAKEADAGSTSGRVQDAVTLTMRRTLNIIGAGPEGLTGTGNIKFGGDSTDGKGLGDWLDGLGQKSDGATEASQRLEQQVNETSDAVDKQTSLITSLDHEMARLLVQKESLYRNDVRSAAEIATLTARFQGLGVYLTNTGNRYDDLTNAVNRYRLAQVNLLNIDLTAQGSALALQTSDAQVRKNQAIGQLENNRLLTAAEQAALKTLRTAKPGDANFGRAQAIVSDASKRFLDDNQANGAYNRALAEKLNSVVQSAGTIATNTALGNSINTRIADNTASTTLPGRKVTAEIAAITGLITRLNSADGADKTKLGQEGLEKVTRLEKYISGVLGTPAFANAGSNKRFLQNALTDITGLRQQINATLLPTKAEAAARAASDREEAKREREQAKKERLVSQQDIDRIGLEMGLKLGSGTRSPEHQESLFRRGVTSARGYAGRGGPVSNHVNSVARDFSVAGLSDEEAERRAVALRARYRAAGINAQVLYERGGPKDGTGRHIHVGVPKGATRRVDRTQETEDKYDLQLAQAQIALDEGNLKLKLKEVAQATTTETFNSAVASAKAALEKVNGQLRRQAEDELATSGFIPGDPQYDARMLQVQQSIDQNVEDFQQKIAAAIIKSTEAQLEAAAKAFEKATANSRKTLQIAQAQAGGLEAYSLRNKVPDYVKSLANDRIGMAQERVARAEYDAYPAQILAQQEAIAATMKQGEAQGVTAELTAKLASMNVELEKLIANREALGAQLGAGGLLPTNLREGLDQAIQAYRQANNMNQTFSQSLIMNLGGALDTVNSGLATMFTSILDGSQTALQAFGNFAKGVMQWMVQLAARAVATQVFNLILSAIGGGFGGSSSSSSATMGNGGITGWAFNGGIVGYPNSPDSIQYYNRGGEVTNGARSHDSVHAKLAKGEFVMRNSAVDSVGTKFMARLNNHGAKALEGLQAVPSLDMVNHVESNIYVVPKDQVPQLGPNDVRVILTDELMNGDSKRLVEHISRSSR